MFQAVLNFPPYSGPELLHPLAGGLTVEEMLLVGGGVVPPDAVHAQSVATVAVLVVVETSEIVQASVQGAQPNVTTMRLHLEAEEMKRCLEGALMDMPTEMNTEKVCYIPLKFIVV